MKRKEIFFVLTENKLITLDDHNENSMKNLLVKGVKRINEFDWIMNIPYYRDQSLKPDEYNWVVKSIQTDFPYCYEHVGNAEILVITPLKDKMNLRHMSKSKYIMKKEKIILCYAFLVQILTVCPIEGKCQKKELIKWILFKEKQFLHLFYLTVQCQITERCSYIIIISKKNEAIIEHMGVFNFYISEENRNMNFKLKNDFSIYFT